MPNSKKVLLKLEDGSVFTGKSFGYQQPVAGEVVFNTAMTGYPESLTDPSYKGQILCMTYPLVGNYGVPDKAKRNQMLRHFESDKIQVSALIISDYSFEYSHWNAKSSLAQWLIENRVPGIYDIDTRALTKVLREKGAMLGKIVFDNHETDWYDPNTENLVAKVSIRQRQVYGNGKHKIMLVDCGVKNNIIRCLLSRDTQVVRVPFDYNFNTESYDGLFITNGPGDPKKCTQTIENLAKAVEKDTPVFGICLGNQLLGLATGANTFKLKYGHRSHNQPVRKAGTNTAYITSQNHGFAIENQTLSPEWEPLFININDQTNEGMKHKTKPFFSTQFHPEATSGPTDTQFLFDYFLHLIKTSKQ